MRSKHYYQGGYDYNFVDDLDPKFECPICLLCQRDPHQTSCGHRFCYSCILTWLNEGRTCPKDNCSLGEGDISADTMAHREIMQLLVHCPFQDNGCKTVKRLADAENHAAQCSVKLQKKPANGGVISRLESSVTCGSCGEAVDEEGGDQHKPLICPNELIACPYTSMGCEEKIPRRSLNQHIQTQQHKHCMLIMEKFLKMDQAQTAASSCIIPSEEMIDSGPDSMPEGGGGIQRAESVRLSGSNIQSTQKLMRDLFQRVVQLEQKNCQQEIQIQQLNARIKDLSVRDRERELEERGRYCNGDFLWRIPDFPARHEAMRHSREVCIMMRYFLCLKKKMHFPISGLIKTKGNVFSNRGSTWPILSASHIFVNIFGFQVMTYFRSSRLSP